MMTRPEFLLTPSVASHSVEGEQALFHEAERQIRLFLAGHEEELSFVPYP